MLSVSVLARHTLPTKNKSTLTSLLSMQHSVQALSTAYNVTYRLGAKTRVLFNEYYPVVAPRVTALYNRTIVLHNEVSDYLRGKLQFA